ncbi:MAG: NAD-dependent epimerase/dehydratase family protein, partial [Candidatus Nitrosomaritimum aestuariumsis]
MSQEIKKITPSSCNPYSIMVTGATGFIGSKLITALTRRGYEIKGMSRREIPDKDHVKFVKTDVFNLEDLTQSLQGIEVAYYLLHSMEGSKDDWENFASREKLQAENFLKAATKAGVRRIIYLGGLVNEGLDLSPHMQSRKQVGEILASGNIPVTELRASIIIGSQGGSYAMLRYLVERLRVMVCPSWVKSMAQPI